MAHDIAPKLPVSVPSAGSDLTRERVRAAVLHLAELAAAFEGAGFEIIDRRTDDSTLDTASCEDAEALGCLTDVVHRLEQHLHTQREHQRDALLTKMHPKLTEHYWDFKVNRDSSELERDIATLLGDLGLQPREQDVKEFVIRPHHLKAQGTKKGGPSEAAARVLAGVIDVDRKTIYNRLREGANRWVRRTSWRRWIPPRLARRYVSELFDNALAARDAEQLPNLEDVVELRSPFFALLERRVEEEFRDWMRDGLKAAFERVLGDDGNPAGIVDDGEWDRMREVRDRLLNSARDAAEADALRDELRVKMERIIERTVDSELRKYGLS